MPEKVISEKGIKELRAIDPIKIKKVRNTIRPTPTLVLL